MEHIEPISQTIIEKQRLLQTLLDNSHKSEIIQCLRLLGMYIALYKEQFGEVETCVQNNFLDAITISPELLRLVEKGLDEANGMLKMIACENAIDPQISKTKADNYVN